MRWRMGVFAAVIFAGSALAARPAAAQRGVTMGSSLHTGSDSYFEQFGVNFGFSLPAGGTGGGSSVVGLTPQGALAPAIQFNQGGANNVAPPFGVAAGQQGGATFGYAVQTSLGTFTFGISAAQGSSRSLSSQSPMITLPDGGSGFFGAGSLTPFVTGVVPVVGGFAAGGASLGDFGDSSLNERLQRIAAGESPTMSANPLAGSTSGDLPNTSCPATGACDPFSRQLAAASSGSAGQPAESIADIRAQQATEDAQANAALREKMQDAEQALAAGKPNVARIYYGQVARHATGALKQQAIDALKSLAAPADGSSHASKSIAPAGAARP